MTEKSRNLLDTSEFYKKLFKKFDKGVNTVLDSFRKKINVSVDKCEQRLKKCEKSLQNYVRKVRDACEEDLKQAEVLVNKELRSKIIISQWTNKFLATSEQASLDPITFAITRFSLNICMNYCDVSPEYLLAANVHKHLIDYISMENNYLVVGPSLMALVHISLYPSIRPAIVAAEGLPAILKIIVNSKSKPLLALSAKLLASLALDSNNKALLSRTGCFHGLGDLILGNHCDVDNEVQIFAVTAIVNLLHHHEANRRLAIELNIVKPILTILQTISTERLLILCVRVLANIAYSNAYTAHVALITGAGDCLSILIEAIDCQRQPILCHGLLSALANMCGNNDMNQTAIGNMDAFVECTVRILSHAKPIYVVTEAANFLLALCWKNNINKSRVAHKGGCVALLERITRHVTLINTLYPPTAATEFMQYLSPYLHSRQQQLQPMPMDMEYYQVHQQHYPTAELRDHVLCTERLCHALSSILLYESTHERLHVVQGLEELVRLCKVTQDANVLISLAKAIIPLIPTPAQLLLYHQDAQKHRAEQLQAILVLKKVKLLGFADLAAAPDWLEAAIAVLSMRDAELKVSTPQSKPEFVDELYYAKEFKQEVSPDATVYDNKDLKGYIFSIY